MKEILRLIQSSVIRKVYTCMLYIMHIMYFDVYTVRQASDQGLHCLPLTHPADFTYMNR